MRNPLDHLASAEIQAHPTSKLTPKMIDSPAPALACSGAWDPKACCPTSMPFPTRTHPLLHPNRAETGQRGGAAARSLPRTLPPASRSHEREQRPLQDPSSPRRAFSKDFFLQNGALQAVTRKNLSKSGSRRWASPPAARRPPVQVWRRGHEGRRNVQRWLAWGA